MFTDVNWANAVARAVQMNMLHAGAANLQFVNNAISSVLKKKGNAYMHITDKCTLCVYVYKILKILCSSIFKYFQTHSLFKVLHVQLFSYDTQL